MELGRKIAELRKKNDLSQQDLANKLNVSNKTISKWECGNSVPDIEILNSLAKIFNVSIDKLVNEQESTDSIVNIQETSRTKNKLNNKKVMLISGIALLCVLVVLIPVLCYCLIPRAPKIESSGIFEINQEKSTISCSVSNTTESFSFNDTFKTADNNTWGLYYDITGTLEIKSKTVLLNVGDNTFYVLIENNSGKKRVYSATVRRRPMFTVQFNTLGGTVVASQTIEENGFAIRPSIIPTKSGYTFVDWEFDFTAPITHTTTITANYSANTYTINYHYKDDTIQQSATFGKTIAIKNEETFNKDYYYISSWNTNKNGTGRQYDCGISCNYTTIGNLDLYPSWTPISYSITYNFVGAIKDDNLYTLKNFNIETETFSLTSPKHISGYTFVGWYIDEDGQNEIKNIQKGSHGALHIYAKYAATHYTISFDKVYQDAADLPPLDVVYGEFFTLPQLENINGYDFAGWEYNGQEFMPEEYLIPKDIKIVAKWNKIFNTKNGNITSLTTYGKQLENINIPSSIDGSDITGINEICFKDNQNLKSVYIANTIKSIGYLAFSDCTNLSNLAFEDNSQLTTLNRNAFSNCTSLTILKLPNSLTNIISYPFSGCNNIETVYISNLTLSEMFYSIPESLKTVIFNEGTTEIKQSALFNCLNVQNIVLPNSVITISDSAFTGCSGLRTIKLPNKLQVIGSSALSRCTGLTELLLPNTLKTVASNAFAGCVGLQQLTIPQSVVSLEYGILTDCNNIETLILPFVGKSRTSITTDCSIKYLYNDKYGNGDIPEKLKSIKITDTTIIGERAFCGLSNINNIKLCDKIESIGYMAFKDCSSLETLVFPENLKGIGESSFYNCIGLTTITLPQKLENISKDAFSHCSNLSCIVFPETLINIGERAFFNCNSLQEIEFVEGLLEIGDYAFSGCSLNGKIAIPNSVQCLGYSIFSGVDNKITSISLPFVGKSRTSNDNEATLGYIFGTYNILIDTLTTVIITEGQIINSSSFNDCRSLRRIILPSSITEIADNSFSNCNRFLEILYYGTELAFNNLNINSDNEIFSYSIYYYCENKDEVTDSYKYWHYDNNGNIEIWKID